MKEKIIILSLLLVCFYFITKPQKTITKETTLIDSIFVTDTVEVKIEGVASSSVEYDTTITIIEDEYLSPVKHDTVYSIDTVYTVQFDTITSRIKVEGETFWRKENRSTYKLNLWLYPDTIEAKLTYLLPDTVRAYMSLNSKVYLDSNIVFIPAIKNPEWYDNNYLWFGLGVFSTAGLVYLIK